MYLVMMQDFGQDMRFLKKRTLKSKGPVQQLMILVKPGLQKIKRLQQPCCEVIIKASTNATFQVMTGAILLDDRVTVAHSIFVAIIDLIGVGIDVIVKAGHIFF